ncbi:SDR family oxidoreductase [uncultured Pseudokineococcus sp.]|uniref:SDR family oxidoreductase n=1 Tax=uncultured Pseudokineococcus sp. TaxID=1642928 RepID=UPI002634D173|nr:SDR family oxidoreductase [uncultured Pseudokineococcus sp.]
MTSGADQTAGTSDQRVHGPGDGDIGDTERLGGDVASDATAVDEHVHAPLGADGRPPLVLVTGVTGYIGGRLVPQLLAAGYRVRAMARHPERLADRPWADDVELVEADANEAADLRRALDGVQVAYYLIHSLGSGRDFEQLDRYTARTFASSAREAGVGRIVYLGGLYPEGEHLSEHLGSRKEVGDIFLASGVPSVVLKAAVIIGSGSASFEMMRNLTEMLPAMVTPKWVRSRIQPIAVRDVLRYLVGAARLPEGTNRGFDIGGPDVLTYREMMQGYAAIAGLKPRVIVPLPVLTPRLASRWVGLVTPVPKKIAQPLVGSLVHDVVCKESDIRSHVPDPEGGLIDFRESVRLALTRIRELQVETTWRSASLRGAPSEPLPTDPDWAGGVLYEDDRSTVVDAPPQHLWAVLQGIGGENGWYSFQLGWWTRGVLDQVFGGPGLRRGRRDPLHLSVGDALDWWRVEAVDRGRLLRLRAEMRLPGLAWLDLSVETGAEAKEAGRLGAEVADDAVVFHQRALFHPRGLPGRLYWTAIVPFHAVVFGGMQRNVAQAAEAAFRANPDADALMRDQAAAAEGRAQTS